MDTIERKNLDPEQFGQDLNELARAYIAAAKQGDEAERCLIFEAMLKMGSDTIAQAESQEDKDKIKTIVMELKGTPDPETLYISMLGYGLGEAMMGVIGTSESREESVLKELRRDVLISVVKIAALICAERTIGKENHLEEAVKTEFDAFVEGIASLPGLYIIKALEMAKEYLASLEQPYEEGPKTLRAPGLRSYLALYRAVRKRMCEKGVSFNR